MNKCNICNELNGDIGSLPPGYVDIVKSSDNIVLSSKDLVVLPSFGPLNNTHVMIVPKAHIYNFSSLSKKYGGQTRALINKLQYAFNEAYSKSLVFFESGAGSSSNHSGGCIVHAHIHCVIQNENFEHNLFKEVDLVKVNDESFFDAHLGYVWYKSVNGQEYLKNNPLLPSQFLRYLYMQSSGSPQSWNWRRNIDVDGIKSVIDTYRKILT